MATDTTVRTITAERARDVSLHLPHGHVTVAVDPAATVASLTLSPAAGAREFPRPAIGNALAREDLANGVLSVAVPGTLLPSREAVERYGLKDRPDLPTGPVSAQVVLPPGANLLLQTEDAGVFTEGALKGVSVRTVSGTVDIDRAENAIVRTVSGSVRARSVLGSLSARSQSGDVVIDHYAGRGAVLSSKTGEVNIVADRGASGAVEITSPIGRGTVLGHTSGLAVTVTHPEAERAGAVSGG